MKTMLKEGQKMKPISAAKLEKMKSDPKVKLTLSRKESTADTKVFTKKSLLVE